MVGIMAPASSPISREIISGRVKSLSASSRAGTTAHNAGVFDQSAQGSATTAACPTGGGDTDDQLDNRHNDVIHGGRAKSRVAKTKVDHGDPVVADIGEDRDHDICGDHLPGATEQTPDEACGKCSQTLG